MRQRSALPLALGCRPHFALLPYDGVVHVVSQVIGDFFGKPTIELKVNGDRGDLDPAKIIATLRSCVRADEFRFGTYDRDAQADDYIAQLEAAGLKEAAIRGEVTWEGGAAGGAGAAAGGAGAGPAGGGDDA